MKVKEILNRYNGDFYIYKVTRNRAGHVVNYEYVAFTNTPWKTMDKIVNKHICNIECSNSILYIYID